MKRVHLRSATLFEFKILPSVRPFIKSESWPVVGFCPHVASTEVFGINLVTLFPVLGPSKEVFSTTNKATGLIMLYHSHLAIEFYNFKFR